MAHVIHVWTFMIASKPRMPEAGRQNDDEDQGKDLSDDVIRKAQRPP